MVRMTSFDADLVRRWFGRLRDPGRPVMPHWGIVPTEQERIALAQGQAHIEFAVLDLPPSGAADRLTEVPARLLRTYLQAMAAGIVGTRQVLAEQVAPGPFAGAGEDTTGVAGDVGTLSLVTGLNAAAAALHGEIDAPAYRSAEDTYRSEPSAAESVRLAGVSAAELVVTGARLHEIAGAAAGAAMGGWKIGVPEDPAERAEYRVRGLIGVLLVALEMETRSPAPPAEPAGCGALPGENLGRAFDAEITFAMGLPPAEIRALSDDLAGLAAEVTVWPGGRWPHFHVHTDRPGQVIGQVYAYGTPFDLLITDRG